MTQSFDEWFDTTTYRGYVDENDMESAWDAGAQSKQAEIDELRKRIENALRLVNRDVSEFGTSNYLDNAINVLKGNTNED